MALTPRLEIRQSQNLSLTPQLMQSIKLLQLSHLEISNFVEQELLRNPLLERDESGLMAGHGQNEGQDPAGDLQGEAGDDAGRNSSSSDLVDRAGQLASAVEIAGDMDTDASNIFPEQVGQDSISASSGLGASSLGASGLGTGSGGAASGPFVSAGGEYGDIEQYVASKVTLGEHLSEQVCLLVDDPVERLIARNLIDNLDDKGYLAADCQAIADQLGADREQVEAVLSKVQRADPPGVFARDLGECLALQLAERDRLDPMMSTLLENLDLVAAGKFDLLKKRTGASSEDLRDMLEEIRSLDPRPGRAFDNSAMQALVPDVYIRPGPDGGWSLELNSDVLPRVLVNRAYYSTISRRARNREEKAFLVDCLQSANWLTRSLDQRAQTILKVATEIARMQDGFLVHGITHLKPMTLKNVADAIQMHESTVSRVTTNKYVSTPRGLFEMKYFFTTALGSSSGESDHSAESVRYLIRQMIEGETLQNILSDDAIADILASSHKIEVARRTVAKYRESMNIPSSVVRRRRKKQELFSP